jgi:hypothetical protein
MRSARSPATLQAASKQLIDLTAHSGYMISIHRNGSKCDRHGILPKIRPRVLLSGAIL